MLTLFSAQAWSESWFKDANIYARMGYSIGGTAPLDMPATIRKLNSYSPRTNLMYGVEFYKPLHNRWGLATGLYIENKGMKTDATVKNYHMEITRGGETLEGLFTGNVDTNVKQWMWTLPILATYELGSQFRLKFGPYGSLITSKNFTGAAYDGYLRKGNPTGDKVLLGHKEGQRGTYDFSKDMRISNGVSKLVAIIILPNIGELQPKSHGAQQVFSSVTSIPSNRPCTLSMAQSDWHTS